VTEILARIWRLLSRVRAVRVLASTWRGRFILAFLVVQLLLPLQYYVSRKDPHDERWSWRMFSPMRMARCQSSFTVDGRPAPLGSKFHEAWLEVVERGRLSVVQRMAEKLCGENAGKPVAVKLDCTYQDRPPASYASPDACTRPLL
jgi:hypothetical protein